MSGADQPGSDPKIRIEATDDGSTRLIFSGDWTLENATGLDQSVAAVEPLPAGRIDLHCAGIGRIDSTGAWLIRRLQDRVRGQGYEAELAGAPMSLSELVKRVGVSEPPRELALPEVAAPIAIANRVGKGFFDLMSEIRLLTGFLGEVAVKISRVALAPWRFRWTGFAVHVEATGLNALPIVGLLSFLIGVVLAYQGASQLAQFGAEIFTVNLLAVSVLREIGILMTAIIVAGRSGSAFAAQIGTMKVNEEVDALRTIGIDPVEALVAPRVVALMVSLPLLTIYANAMGLLGGAVICIVSLDISVAQFITQLQSAISIWTYWLGLIKAPVFAFAIALVGCYQGLRVTGGAAGVGRRTTMAVVEAIFIVIVADAFFSIVFAELGI